METSWSARDDGGGEALIGELGEEARTLVPTLQHYMGRQERQSDFPPGDSAKGGTLREGE